MWSRLPPSPGKDGYYLRGSRDMNGNKSHKNHCKFLRRVYRKVSHQCHGKYLSRRLRRERRIDVKDYEG